MSEVSPQVNNSVFTLTIDWLAFTLLDASVNEVMKVIGGEWSRGKAGFRGYPISWILADPSRGVGLLGTGAPRRPREVHVDLSAGIVSSWELPKVRAILQWIFKQQGRFTRLDCALDDRHPVSRVSAEKGAIKRDRWLRRTVPVNQTVMALLKAKAKVRRLNTDLVFPSRTGTLIDPNHLRRALRTATTRVGLQDFHFHDLRHTFATRLVQAGVDLYKVQRLFGHKTPMMTQRYAHHYPESLRGGVEILDRRRRPDNKIDHSVRVVGDRCRASR